MNNIRGLRATQVYERLKAYGYQGGYGMVSVHTGKLRKKRHEAYHELEFLPGEEAQIDWMEATLPFGKVYGFVFILAYSRYLFVQFYPRSALEFFSMVTLKHTGRSAALPGSIVMTILKV